jgi:hypothetical protein
MNRFLRALLAGTLALALGGCVPFPRKADLEQVHDTYRDEFEATFLGDTQAGTASCKDLASKNTDLFPKTLKAIHDYDVKYAAEDASTVERAHLTVLKGMIHVQVGNTGIARSLIGDVQKTPITASGDREVRDRLFQKAFPYLVDGWEQLCREGSAERDVETLVKAADGVVKVSDAAADKRSADSAAGKPAADAGAIYLATTGAIFYRYSFQARVDKCMDEGVVGKAKNDRPTCQKRAAKEGELGKGAAAIDKFLTSEERNAAKGGAAGNDWQRVVPRSRLRYVQWYMLLSSEQAKLQ